MDGSTRKIEATSKFDKFWEYVQIYLNTSLKQMKWNQFKAQKAKELMRLKNLHNWREPK